MVVLSFVVLHVVYDLVAKLATAAVAGAGVRVVCVETVDGIVVQVEVQGGACLCRRYRRNHGHRRLRTRKEMLVVAGGVLCLLVLVQVEVERIHVCGTVVDPLCRLFVVVIAVRCGAVGVFAVQS